MEWSPRAGGKSFASCHGTHAGRPGVWDARIARAGHGGNPEANWRWTLLFIAEEARIVAEGYARTLRDAQAVVEAAVGEAG